MGRGKMQRITPHKGIKLKFNVANIQTLLGKSKIYLVARTIVLPIHILKKGHDSLHGLTLNSYKFKLKLN